MFWRTEGLNHAGGACLSFCTCICDPCNSFLTFFVSFFARKNKVYYTWLGGAFLALTFLLNLYGNLKKDDKAKAAIQVLTYLGSAATFMYMLAKHHETKVKNHENTADTLQDAAFLRLQHSEQKEDQVINRIRQLLQEQDDVYATFSKMVVPLVVSCAIVLIALAWHCEDSRYDAYCQGRDELGLGMTSVSTICHIYAGHKFKLAREDLNASVKEWREVNRARLLTKNISNLDELKRARDALNEKITQMEGDAPVAPGAE